MGGTSDLLFREGGEPALYEIDPGSAGGREVHVEAGALGQPGADGSSLVSAVVVQDQMDIQRCRDCVIDGVEEFAKLAAAMAPVTFADDCACLHIQSGEQGRRAVAFVIVAAAAVPELQAVPEPATLWF